ncbi:MAG: hypothetical protein LBS33_08515 [Streptococcaceae bacterium]|nr:hypothetical protein [Streptococcaceae bacterium]
MTLQQTKQSIAQIETGSNQDDQQVKQDLQKMKNIYDEEIKALKANDLEKFSNLENQIDILRLKRIISDKSEEYLTFQNEAWFQPFKKFLPFEYLGYGRLVNDIEILPSNAFIIGMVYLLSLSSVFIVFSGYLYKNYYYRKVGKL